MSGTAELQISYESRVDIVPRSVNTPTVEGASPPTRKRVTRTGEVDQSKRKNDTSGTVESHNSYETTGVDIVPSSVHTPTVVGVSSPARKGVMSTGKVDQSTIEKPLCRGRELTQHSTKLTQHTN